MNQEEIQARFDEYMANGEKPFDYERRLLIEEPERVKAILRGENPPPYEIEIQLSSNCGAHCLHCFGKKLVKLENRLGNKGAIQRIANDVVSFYYKDFFIKNIKFCGSTGDPFNNEYAEYAIDRLNEQKGRRKLIVFTNGIKLGQRKKDAGFLRTLGKINILNLSLDAGSTEILQIVKPGAREAGVELKDILEGARELHKRGVNVSVGYVVTTHNYNDIVNAARVVKEFGFDSIKYRIDMCNRAVSKFSGESIKKLLEEAKKYEENNFQVVQIHDNDKIDSLDEKDFSSRGLEFKCFTSSLWTSIGSDGNVYPCGHASSGDMESYGNILEQSFGEIWNGEKRKNLVGKLPCDKCKICSPSSLRKNSLMTFLSELPISTSNMLIDNVAYPDLFPVNTS